MIHNDHKRDATWHTQTRFIPTFDFTRYTYFEHFKMPCVIHITIFIHKQTLVLNVQLLWSTLISKCGWLELVWSALIELNGIVMVHYIFGLITLNGYRWLGKSKKLSGKEIDEIGKPLIDPLAIKVIERSQIKRYNLNYTQLCLWWTNGCFDKTRFLPKGQPL